jgi:hypothetical protein
MLEVAQLLAELIRSSGGEAAHLVERLIAVMAGPGARDSQHTDGFSRTVAGFSLPAGVAGGGGAGG